MRRALGAVAVLRLTTVLFALAFLDELASGIPSTAASEIERTLGLPHATTALVLFVVPGILALIVEPVLFLLADRYPRAWFVRGGLVTMAIAATGCALAPNAYVLAAAMALSWSATGAAIALGQATLVDARPEARGQTMARWTLLSTLGDLAAPLALGGIALLGGTWRLGFGVVAGVLALAAIAACLTPFPPPARDDEAENAPSLLASLREAVTDRVLLAWLFAVAMCDLLDEILVVFATIHVREVFGASATAQAVIVAAGMVGGIGGLVALERLLPKHGERTLLIAAGVGCGVAFVAWMLAPTLAASALLMLPVGAFSAPLYPLAAAQTFARRPEASGSVLAAGHLFTPLGLALPWVVGVIADRAGTSVALLVLLAQPVVIVALAWRRHGAPSRPSSDR